MSTRSSVLWLSFALVAACTDLTVDDTEGSIGAVETGAQDDGDDTSAASSSADTTGGPADPCAVHLECAECVDTPPFDCAFCAGTCVTPPEDADEEGAWCEWGFVDHAGDCEFGAIPTNLEIDCRSARNQDDPHCIDGGESATVGSGPQFPPGGIGQIYGGFLDPAENRIVLAGWQNDLVPHAIVFAVDLTTGDRTVVSGLYLDPINGEVPFGSGPELGRNTWDIEPSPDGSWIVAGESEVTASYRLTRIDPASGDRTIIYEFVFGDSTTACQSPLYEYSPAPIVDLSNPPAIAIAADGIVYAPTSSDFYRPNDYGIAAVDSAGTCSIVTLATPDPEFRVGGGPRPEAEYQGIELIGSTVYALARYGELHAIDPTTGDRTVVSVDNGTATLGDGPPLDVDMLNEGLDGKLWLSGNTGGGHAETFMVFIDVDLRTGNRTGYTNDTRGPIGGSDSVLFVAPHPTLPGVALAVMNDALLLFEYEPATGNNMIISH